VNHGLTKQTPDAQFNGIAFRSNELELGELLTSRLATQTAGKSHFIAVRRMDTITDDYKSESLKIKSNQFI